MRNIPVFIIFIIAIVFAAGAAMATPPGKDIAFKGGAMGNVTFSGTAHHNAGLKCADCHTKIFPMKGPENGGVKFTMADIKAGKFCGECHNGQKAFDVTGNCTKCHKK